MKYKDVQSRYILLARIFILLAVIGLGILIVTSIGDDPSNLAFSLIAFVISVAALLMTVLQSASIARQVYLTEKAARELKDTGEQLHALIDRDTRLAREIHQDIELDHEIIGVLEEHGIGANDTERHHVAKRIAQRLKSSHKQSR